MELEHSKQCSHCGERKSLDDFNKKKRDGYYGYDHRCRDCLNLVVREVVALRKTAPPKPDTCECCGSVADLQLDHNHLTVKFRGWICKPCNVRVGYVERAGKKQPDYIYKYIDERK